MNLHSSFQGWRRIESLQIMNNKWQSETPIKFWIRLGSEFKGIFRGTFSSIGVLLYYLLIKISSKSAVCQPWNELKQGTGLCIQKVGWSTSSISQNLYSLIPFKIQNFHRGVRKCTF